jgi:hypothetical protein
MKIQRFKNLPWPTNPKTPDGWPKRVALAMLSGLGVFVLSLPVSVLVLLHHYDELYPKDPQNLLSALTGAVLVGLTLAALGFTALLAIFFLLGLRGRPTTS